MRRQWIVLLVAAVVMPIALFAAWIQQTSGVRVTVINAGPDPLSEVVVHVTGNQHRIGDLAVGESRTVGVDPTSESHVELSFEDQPGRPHRLDAGGYFEQGYRGIIEVELEKSSIKRNKQQIELGWF